MDRDFIIGKNLALKLLNRYDKTCKEMKKYLLDKCLSEETSNRVVEYLCQYNFLDDRRYAKNYIRKNMCKYGEKKIFFDLVLKGVNEEFLKEELMKISDCEKIEAGVKICRKKYDSIKNKFEGFKMKHKLFCHLITKGYDYDMANQIIEKSNLK